MKQCVYLFCLLIVYASSALAIDKSINFYQMIGIAPDIGTGLPGGRDYNQDENYEKIREKFVAFAKVRATLPENIREFQTIVFNVLKNKKKREEYNHLVKTGGARYAAEVIEYEINEGTKKQQQETAKTENEEWQKRIQSAEKAIAQAMTILNGDLSTQDKRSDASHKAFLLFEQAGTDLITALSSGLRKKETDAIDLHAQIAKGKVFTFFKTQFWDTTISEAQSQLKKMNKLKTEIDRFDPEIYKINQAIDEINRYQEYARRKQIEESGGSVPLTPEEIALKEVAAIIDNWKNIDDVKKIQPELYLKVLPELERSIDSEDMVDTEFAKASLEAVNNILRIFQKNGKGNEQYELENFASSLKRDMTERAKRHKKFNVLLPDFQEAAKKLVEAVDRAMPILERGRRAQPSVQDAERNRILKEVDQRVQKWKFVTDIFYIMNDYQSIKGVLNGFKPTTDAKLINIMIEAINNIMRIVKTKEEYTEVITFITLMIDLSSRDLKTEHVRNNLITPKFDEAFIKLTELISKTRKTIYEKLDELYRRERQEKAAQERRAREKAAREEEERRRAEEELCRIREEKEKEERARREQEAAEKLRREQEDQRRFAAQQEDMRRRAEEAFERVRKQSDNYIQQHIDELNAVDAAGNYAEAPAAIKKARTLLQAYKNRSPREYNLRKVQDLENSINFLEEAIQNFNLNTQDLQDKISEIQELENNGRIETAFREAKKSFGYYQAFTKNIDQKVLKELQQLVKNLLTKLVDMQKKTTPTSRLSTDLARLATALNQLNDAL